MIREQDLLDAIAECQGEKNPNANTCMKLAAYYTILDHVRERPAHSFDAAPSRHDYNSGSEFSDSIRGKDYKSVLSIMDELMDSIGVLAPKLYRATLAKISAL